MVEKGPWVSVKPGLLVVVCPVSVTVRPGLGPSRVLGLGWDNTTRTGAFSLAVATVGDLATFGVAMVTVAVVPSGGGFELGKRSFESCVSGEVGETRPWMVPETRAETALRQRVPGEPGVDRLGSPVE